MTYRSFTTPDELLTKLILRFNTPPSEDVLDEKQFEEFRKKFMYPVRLRVCQFLKSWIGTHFYDFREDSALKDKLLEFISDIGKAQMEKASKDLLQLFSKQLKRVSFNIIYL